MIWDDRMYGTNKGEIYNYVKRLGFIFRNHG